MLEKSTCSPRVGLKVAREFEDLSLNLILPEMKQISRWDWISVGKVGREYEKVAHWWLLGAAYSRSGGACGHHTTVRKCILPTRFS